MKHLNNSISEFDRYCGVKGCFNKHCAKGYCEKHYANNRKYGYPIKPFYTRPLDFKVDEKGCFNCTSHKPNRDGYPTYRIRGKQWLMSRFVYTEMFGKIPEGLVIRHKCDNANCINPEHLEIGTVHDNNQDKIKRDRNPKGSEVWNSILNEGKVREIKILLSEKELTNNEIAEKHGVNYRIISNIKHGRRWGHVKI